VSTRPEDPEKGSGNRLAWGFLPSADPRGRACRLDRESAARTEPLLGGRKPTLPAGQPPGTDPQTFEPPAQFNWYGRQLACLCAHANMDTIEKPTMSQPSSKIERPALLSPCGESVDARIARAVTTPGARRLIPGRRQLSPARPRRAGLIPGVPDAPVVLAVVPRIRYGCHIHAAGATWLGHPRLIR